MDIKKWIPLLISQKRLILSHIERIYGPHAKDPKGISVVMDTDGNIRNRILNPDDIKEIKNGNLFLIYKVSDITDYESDAEYNIDLVLSQLSTEKKNKFILSCTIEKASSFIQKEQILKRDYPDDYADILEVYNSVCNFESFTEAPDSYERMLKAARESKDIEDYLNNSFSDNF